MDINNSRTLLIKAAGILGAASLSALISLPALSQQSPNNSNPDVPSTATPTNPAGRDAGTTNGGEDLNRVPSSGTNPIPGSDASDRMQRPGQETQQRTNVAPDSNNQPANQPGATTGGESIQQVRPTGGSMMQQRQGQGQRTQQRSNTNAFPRGINRGINRPANQPGATTGGEAVQQVRPTGGSTMQQGQGQDTQPASASPRSDGQPGDPAMQQMPPMNGSMQQTQPMNGSVQQTQPMTSPQQPGQGVYPRTNATPRSNDQSDDNQSGVTTGGEATQQVQPTNGSSQQRTQTTPRSGSQVESQQSTPQSGNNSDFNNRQSSPQSEAPGEGVRALW